MRNGIVSRTGHAEQGNDNAHRDDGLKRNRHVGGKTTLFGGVGVGKVDSTPRAEASPKELPPDKRQGRGAALPLESPVLGEIHVGHVIRMRGWEAGSLA